MHEMMPLNVAMIICDVHSHNMGFVLPILDYAISNLSPYGM